MWTLRSWPWVGVAEYELRASNTKVKDFYTPPPLDFSLFYGHRWPSRPPSFILTECWRSYRIEQRIVVRAA